jgi:hypothetical protein
MGLGVLSHNSLLISKISTNLVLYLPTAKFSAFVG